jgi:hypothetical protein
MGHFKTLAIEERHRQMSHSQTQEHHLENIRETLDPIKVLRSCGGRKHRGLKKTAPQVLVQTWERMTRQEQAQLMDYFITNKLAH